MYEPIGPVERTLVLIKPDAVKRLLVGEIIDRYQNKGLSIVAMELRTIDGDMADKHYAAHVDKAWYPPLREFITSGPLVAMILEGEYAISAVRKINGATNGVEAEPGSIRGDYCISNRYNAVHASDSEESAAQEMALWFPGLT